MSKKVTITSLILDTIFIILISISYYSSLNISTSRVIFIPQGGINEIISHLIKNNFELSYVDSLLLRAIGKPQNGWIDIGENRLSRGDFLHKIATSKAALKDITLIPGDSNYFFLHSISETLDLNMAKLLHHYNRFAPYKDGVILADTYYVPLGISEEHLMYYLVNHSINRHKSMSIKILGEYDQNQWFKYVTIASIIQKEAANYEEMPIISGVIRNRLKRGMPLQMDGSLKYGEFSKSKITPKRIREDSSYFNTYKYKGVPPEPVGSISFDALRAAIFPQDVEYLYFVKNRDGVHDFSTTFEEHKKNIQKSNN